ncbi:MAG TPA: acetolactate synthase small subunit [Myxococcales bacterium]|jgi:acetolactate synthase-1/3 small subunit|nr:acetolactate synthase small subunit [Myxococcales bacterium]
MKDAVAHTFVATVEDRPGALNRVVSLFRRRGFNIASLTVGRTERPGVSRIALVVQADDDTARRVQANLEKLVDVLQVTDLTRTAAVAREFALVKACVPADKRAELLRLCSLFRARVVDVSPATLTVEITGEPDKVDALLELVRPYGIAEMVRTGPLAMGRGGEGAEVKVQPEMAA